VFIDNIHIRYEDSVSNKKNPFALGLFVSSIQVQSTDAAWQPNFNVAKRETMFKVCVITISVVTASDPEY
jgi:vacuolar protein sorting-associated protein 13A/C